MDNPLDPGGEEPGRRMTVRDVDSARSPRAGRRGSRDEKACPLDSHAARGVSRPRPFAAAAIAVLCASFGLGPASTAAARWTRPRPEIRSDLPAAASAGTRVGEVVTVSGRVIGAPAGARVALEEKREASPGPWRVLRETAPHHGRFSLSWRPTTTGFSMLRVSVRRRGHDLRSTPAHAVRVGAAPRYCAPAAPPTNVPAGDGWITGGLYNSGGPAPGVYECVVRPYTLTVADPAGATVAAVQVPAGLSYTVVLPPGPYTLNSGYCHGAATVTAGHRTAADTVCNIP
jgi:hypothetical protein